MTLAVAVGVFRGDHDENRQPDRQTEDTETDTGYLVVTLAVAVGVFRGDHDENLDGHQERHQAGSCHHVAGQGLHGHGQGQGQIDTVRLKKGVGLWSSVFRRRRRSW